MTVMFPNYVKCPKCNKRKKMEETKAHDNGKGLWQWLCHSCYELLDVQKQKGQDDDHK